MSEDDKEPLTFLGKPIPRSFEEGLDDLSKQRRRIKESPLVKNIRALLEGTNESVLSGSGRVATNYGETPADTTFSLEWKGEITPMKKVKFENINLLVFPFHLEVEAFKESDESNLRFKVRANYGTEEDVEVGITEHLLTDEVKPIIESQVENIRESSKH
jgi:hypothetical protein